METVLCWWFESYRGQDFCNAHLFRVPRSWAVSVQMKSSMTFIRCNRYREREKDHFKNDREIKRIKECALAWNLKVIGSDVHTSVYNKRDDFGLSIVNFPLLSGDFPTLPSYGICILQLVRFSMCCTSVLDFHSKHLQILQNNWNRFTDTTTFGIPWRNSVTKSGGGGGHNCFPWKWKKKRRGGII